MSEEQVMELELDGKIYAVVRDSSGELISREELDGELMLQVLLKVLDDAIRERYISPGFFIDHHNNKEK
jgi:hypothetical protein